jgi:PKD repeat protein
MPGVDINFDATADLDMDRWEWNFPGGSPGSSTEQNPQIRYDNAGSYDVILISEYCGKADTLMREDFISIETEEIIDVDFRATTRSICPEETVIFFDETDPVDNIVHWAWTFEGTSGFDLNYDEYRAAPIAVQYRNPGVFDVQLMIISANGDTTINLREDYIVVDSCITSTLEPLNGLNKLELTPAPNPFEDFTDLYFTVDRTGIFDIEVLIIHGQKVYENNFTVNQLGEQKYRLNLSEFPSGLYHVKVQNKHYLGQCLIVRAKQ